MIQAFRCENGMGRMVFDMAAPKAGEELGMKPWLHRHQSEYVPEMALVRARQDQTWPNVNFPNARIELPCRVTGEIVLPKLSGGWSVKIVFRSEDAHEVYVIYWLSKRNALEGSGRYVLPGNAEGHPLPSFSGLPPFEKTFQLPKKMIEETSGVKIMLVGLANVADDLRYEESGLSLLDIVGKFSGVVDFEIGTEGGAVVVTSLGGRSLAYRAGLREGDEIVRFNGTRRDAEQIRGILGNLRFGDLLTVAVLREGEERIFRFHAEP